MAEQGASSPAARSPLHQLLERQPVVILDGAMGTQIEERGITLANTRLWSSQLLIDDPGVVRDIHLEYLRAGSDIVTTCTYQASIDGFAAQGVDAQGARDQILHAVQLAADARKQFLEETAAGAHPSPTAGARPRTRPLIGFSAGSYGACLCDGSEFTGAYADTIMTQEQLEAWHLQRLEPVLEDPRVDLLCFETVPCLLEVSAICHLLSTHPQLRGRHAWVSCSCRDAQHTCHGELFAERVVPLLWACDQVAAIGINCTDPKFVPQLLADAQAKLDDLADKATSGVATSTAPWQAEAEGVVARVRQAADAPVLLCYPNSGEEWDGEHRCWKGGTGCDAPPERFAQAARAWVAAGARAVGGCCRTGPEHIRRLREAQVPAA